MFFVFFLSLSLLSMGYSWPSSIYLVLQFTWVSRIVFLSPFFSFFLSLEHFFIAQSKICSYYQLLSTFRRLWQRRKGSKILRFGSTKILGNNHYYKFPSKFPLLLSFLDFFIICLLIFFKFTLLLNKLRVMLFHIALARQCWFCL